MPDPRPLQRDGAGCDIVFKDIKWILVASFPCFLVVLGSLSHSSILSILLRILKPRELLRIESYSTYLQHSEAIWAMTLFEGP